MASVRELTRLMQELEDQLVVCMRCGMCQSVCPLFEQTGREADVARGKLALLDGLMQELFDDPAGVQERLNRCLLCGSCAANCPSGVNVLDIFMKARAILSGYQGLSPAKQVVLRGMLSRPALFDRLAEWGARFQKLVTKPVNDVVGTSCGRLASPLLKDRHFIPLAPSPFHRKVPSLSTRPGRSGIKVAFYVGCLLDKIFPRIAEAVLDVMAHHEVGVFMPDSQACCGIPAISSGDTRSFHRMLRHNLERFRQEEFDYLITACATCTSTIKKVWPVMADQTVPGLKPRVDRIVERTIDINSFLVDRLGVQPVPADPSAEEFTITYHDPCHLKKSLKVAEAPRTLLRTNPRYRFQEMAAADWCCGMGGSFNLQYYDISSKIGRQKRENIVSTGCDVLATGCPACMLQISDMLSAAGDRIAIRHPVEVYAESLKSV